LAVNVAHFDSLRLGEVPGVATNKDKFQQFSVPGDDYGSVHKEENKRVSVLFKPVPQCITISNILHLVTYDN